MEEAGFVDGLESIEQSLEQLLGDLRRQFTVAGQTLLEGFAASQPHDHVRRSVGFEKVIDADDGRSVIECRQNAGLLEKAVASPNEIFRKLSGARYHHRVFAK